MNKRIRVSLFLAVMLCILISGIAQAAPAATTKASDPARFLIRKEGLFGYIDINGKVVIKPTFKLAGEFSEGVASACKESQEGETRCGYIDSKGKFVIEPVYYDALEFHEGWARVAVAPHEDREGVTYQKFGYINKKGQLLSIPDGIEPYGDFSNGMASVYREIHGNLLYGFINTKGQLTIPAKYAEIKPFSEGLAAVAIDSNGEWKWGFIDKTGKMMIKPVWDQVGSFYEGAAHVSHTAKTGFIDKTGKMTIVTKEAFMENGYREGLALITTPNGALVFIDKKGKFAIPAKTYYESGSVVTEGFSEGLALIMIGHNNFGFIDKKGKFVVKLYGYREVSDFKNGLARVIMGDYESKIGYVNKQGKLVWKPQS